MSGRHSFHRGGALTVLFDKDGTLIENVPMSADPSRMRLMPGATRALRRLAEHGCAIGVVSNQPGVAMGAFPESALAEVERHLSLLIQGCGARLDCFLYCPHHPDGVVPAYRRVCECRKPAPGLVREAMRRLGANPASTWLVGDILDDVEAAHRAGARAILFDSGGETEWHRSPLRTPEFAMRDLGTIVDVILARAECAA